MRSATAPPSRPKRGKMNPAELEEKVLELERYKKEEAVERARQHAKRKKELLGARRQLQREIKKTHQEVRARAAEVEGIERAVLKVQETESKSIERQKSFNIRFQDRVTDLESRTSEKAHFLQERMTELGHARGRLAHLQFALRSLDDNLIVPIETFPAAAEGGETVASGPPLSGPELTASLRRQAEELRSEARRLERENGMLHEELKEVRRVFHVGVDDLQGSKSSGFGLTMSGVDTEASRAEPAPEPPATLSRLTTAATMDSHAPTLSFATTAATVSHSAVPNIALSQRAPLEAWQWQGGSAMAGSAPMEAVHLRAGAGPSLTAGPRTAVASRSWSPVPGASWPVQGLLDSGRSTTMTSGCTSSRISFPPSPLQSVTAPAQMGLVGVPLTVAGAAAHYPMPGINVRPWASAAGGIPVAA